MASASPVNSGGAADSLSPGGIRLTAADALFAREVFSVTADCRGYDERWVHLRPLRSPFCLLPAARCLLPAACYLTDNPTAAANIVVPGVLSPDATLCHRTSKPTPR